MRALIPVLAIAVIALAVVLVFAIQSRTAKSRENRRERARHEAFLADLHKQAIAHSGANVLADYFADLIRNHLTEKEIPR